MIIGLRKLLISFSLLIALGYGSGRLAAANVLFLLQTLAGPAHAMAVAPDVVAKNCIKMISPAYPGMARSFRISGDVLLQVTISKSGDVVAAELVRGHPLLVESAMATVKEWKYKPYVIGGHPVEISTQITVKFDPSVPDRAVSYPNGAPPPTPEPSAIPRGLDTGVVLNKAFDQTGRLDFDGAETPDRREDWTVDRAGNVYLVNSENHSITRIAAATGEVRRLGAAGKVAQTANGLIAVDGSGNVYVTLDFGTVYKISAKTGEATPLGTAAMAADGPYQGVSVTSLTGLAVDASGNMYLAVDGAIRRKSATTGITTEAARVEPGRVTGAGVQFAVDPAGNLYLNSENKIEKISMETGSKMTAAGRIADFRKDRRVEVREGVLATSVNDLHSDGGLAVDAAGNIYFASKGGFWKIDGKSGLISRVANRPEAYRTAKLMVDGAGNLYAGCEGYIQRFLTSQMTIPVTPNAQTGER